jgi:hypothetical protein
VARETVSKHDKYNVSHGKSQTISACSASDFFGKLFLRYAVKYNPFYGLFTRRDEQRLTRMIDEMLPMSYPNEMLRKGLLLVVEANIFRIWYDALGRVKVLQHKTGLDGPPCNRPLHLPSETYPIGVPNHRTEMTRNAGFQVTHPTVVTVIAHNFDNLIERANGVLSCPTVCRPKDRRANCLGLVREDVVDPLGKDVLPCDLTRCVSAKHARVSQSSTSHLVDGRYSAVGSVTFPACFLSGPLGIALRPY